MTPAEDETISVPSFSVSDVKDMTEISGDHYTGKVTWSADGKSVKIELTAEDGYIFKESDGSTKKTVTLTLSDDSAAESDDKEEETESDDSSKSESSSTDDSKSSSSKTDSSKSDSTSGSTSDSSSTDAVIPDNGNNKYQTGSNAALIAANDIVEAPVIEEDFRFATVARKYAFAKEDLSIREEMKDDSREVGTLAKDGLCYVLSEEDGGWLYVESGTVRGFIRADSVVTGSAAQDELTSWQDKAGTESIETVAPLAVETVERTQNKAFTYKKITAHTTVVEKDYAIAESDLNILESANDDAEVVGTLAKNGLCYVLADKDKDYIYVESGDVRGFVKKDSLKLDDEAKAVVTVMTEDKLKTAESKMETEDNDALYYTLTSVRERSESTQLRNAIVKYAQQFVGNPYVWGGTSLTHGADCSGFVQSIYKQFGYSLPRTAAEQAQVGTKISIDSAEPGDLIFYARNGYIYHVVMYIGDGKTVEAMSTKIGITNSTVNTGSAVWACRIIEDSSAAEKTDIDEENVTEDQVGEDLGKFTISYYCPCEVCNSKALDLTATGDALIEGTTCAVDPEVIPVGTKLVINNHIYTAVAGSDVEGNQIAIYVNNHSEVKERETADAEVYLAK